MVRPSCFPMPLRGSTAGRTIKSDNLAEHPVIVEVLYNEDLSTRVCNYFSRKGHTAVPSAVPKPNLSDGSTKSVPTLTLCHCLSELGVQHVRVTNFGMKQKAKDFFNIDTHFIVCAPTRLGFPHNHWDIRCTQI